MKLRTMLLSCIVIAIPIFSAWANSWNSEMIRSHGCNNTLIAPSSVRVENPRQYSTVMPLGMHSRDSGHTAMILVPSVGVRTEVRSTNEAVAILAEVSGITSRYGNCITTDTSYKVGDAIIPKVWEECEEFCIGQIHFNQFSKNNQYHFYDYRIGDNILSINKRSYRKSVTGRAGYEIQSSGTLLAGYCLSIGLKRGNVKISPFEVQRVDHAIRAKRETELPITMLNITSSYDLGRMINTSQLFATLGLDYGSVKLAFNDDIRKFPPTGWSTFGLSYFDLYIGCLKKYYIGKIGLYFEPLIQYQGLSMKLSGLAPGVNRALSFSPNVGIEFAIPGNIILGFALNVRTPISLRTVTKDLGLKIDFPKAFLGAYVGLDMSGFSFH